MPKGEARKAVLSLPVATVSEQRGWQEGDPGLQRWAVAPEAGLPCGHVQVAWRVGCREGSETARKETEWHPADPT